MRRDNKNSVQVVDKSVAEFKTREMMLPLGPRLNQAEASVLLVEMGKVALQHFKSLVGGVSSSYSSNDVVKNVSDVFAQLCSGRAMVPPRGTCCLYGQPQSIFRPERLVLDDESCRHFGIVDIKVGKNSQLVSCDGLIPGSACSASAFGVRLKCDTAQISMYVSAAIVNITDDWQPFPTAVFIGLTAETVQAIDSEDEC
jgi:hypothetical protein